MAWMGRRVVWLATVIWGCLLGGVGPGADAASRVLYETKFEASEGFDPALTLIGQGGWVGFGTGGNGLVSDFLAGEGQSAFIGFTAPAATNDFLNVWRPVNFVPGGTNASRVRFTVLMSIEDSASKTNRDDFRWSIYNSVGDRLFTLDFDNDRLEVNYLLNSDDDQFVFTGQTFTNSTTYELDVQMDFPANRWSATLDGRSLATNLAISTKSGTKRDFGDADAVWAVRTKGKAGDNFMVFDRYRVLAETADAGPPPRLEALGALKPGEFLVRCRGTSGGTYVIEGTDDLRTWLPLKTNSMPSDGFFDHLDKAGTARRFYRAKGL